MAAGDFLAPTGVGNADVVILEGTKVIREKGVKAGMSLLASQRAQSLVIVYHDAENERIFAWPTNYNSFLSQKLEELGLKKERLRVIEVPDIHPITFTEAQIVLSHLSGQGVKSAILLSEGFHTRRSFWTYKQVGLPMGIKIIPYPYFIKYHNDDWWQKVDGAYAFMNEFLKFIYYLLCGYIPVKSLVK